MSPTHTAVATLQARRPDVEFPVEGTWDPAFEPVAAAFRHNFSAEAEEYEIGACVAVYHRGRLVVDMWGGYQDSALETPWGADTLVNMMSVGKGVGAMVVHQLADRGGVLDLDRPVASYWPEFAQHGKQDVLVRHVLDHRAGVPVIDGLWPGAIFDHDAMADALARQVPALKPGEEAGYHVLTYGYLLNEVVRRTTGATIGELLRTEIAGPLGADYAIGLTDEESARCAEYLLATKGTILDRPALPPGSLLSRTWDQVPEDLTFNEPNWRFAEIVSANGHGTARGVARLYAAFCRGELDGVHVISQEGARRAIAMQHRLTERVMGRTYRQALGFVMDSPPVLWLGDRPRSFGHHGVGGSVGMADPDHDVALAYAPNRMHHHRVDNGPRAGNLIRAMYVAVEAIECRCG